MGAGWILSTDFDGTLVNHHAHPPVPDELVSWITEFRKQGGIWVINTGRELPYLMAGIRHSNLRIVPDYSIVVEREIYRFESGEYEPVFPWYRLCADQHREVFTRYISRWPVLIEWIHSHAKAIVYQDKYSPFSVIADDDHQASLIHPYLEAAAKSMEGVHYVHNSIYGRFAHQDFHKGSALTELARILNVPSGQIIVAGDHWNDMSMFDPQRAQWWITPGNAIEPIRSHVARWKCGHVASRPCGLGILDGLLALGLPVQTK
jgi:HAD superfamily hydrolase (TIGR01484 family)